MSFINLPVSIYSYSILDEAVDILYALQKLLRCNIYLRGEHFSGKNRELVSFKDSSISFKILLHSQLNILPPLFFVRCGDSTQNISFPKLYDVWDTNITDISQRFLKAFRTIYIEGKGDGFRIVWGDGKDGPLTDDIRKANKLKMKNIYLLKGHVSSLKQKHCQIDDWDKQTQLYLKEHQNVQQYNHFKPTPPYSGPDYYEENRYPPRDYPRDHPHDYPRDHPRDHHHHDYHRDHRHDHPPARIPYDERNYNRPYYPPSDHYSPKPRFSDYERPPDPRDPRGAPPDRSSSPTKSDEYRYYLNGKYLADSGYQLNPYAEDGEEEPFMSEKGFKFFKF